MALVGYCSRFDCDFNDDNCECGLGEVEGWEPYKDCPRYRKVD